MKRWSILAMLAASFTAFGQERAVHDLMYLPEAYTFYTKASYDMLTEKSEFDAATDGDLRVETKTAIFDFGYVLKENFSLEASVGYQGITTLQELDGAAETETRNKGITNPTLRFKWRALDQRTEEVSVDIIPYVSLKTGTAEEATANDDGNAVTGNGYGVEVNVGKKTEAYQFMGIAKINHSMRHQSDDITYDPRTRYEIGGVYQKTLAKSLFGNVSLSRIHSIDYRDDNDTANTFERFSSRDAWSLGLEGLITPMKDLALSLGYKHFLPSDYSSKDNNGDKTKYENNRASAITMYARYQF